MSCLSQKHGLLGRLNNASLAGDLARLQRYAIVNILPGLRGVEGELVGSDSDAAAVFSMELNEMIRPLTSPEVEDPVKPRSSCQPRSRIRS